MLQVNGRGGRTGDDADAGDGQRNDGEASDAEANADIDANTNADADAGTDAKTDTDPSIDANADADADADAKTDADTDADSPRFGGYVNPVRLFIVGVGLVLARYGVIDEDRARRTGELSWPRVVVGFARISQSAADLAMVGAVLGTLAITGIGFASPFWVLSVVLANGIAGGVINQVSQRFGASRYDELSVVVIQGFLVTVAVTVPMATVFVLFPTELVSLIAEEPQSIAYGATYLQILGPAVVCRSLNIWGSRVLVGADDAWTPMILRGGGALANIGLNAVLIFGLGLGVAGAALGTAISIGAVTCCFVWGVAGGWLPFVGRFPVTVDLGGPYLDRALLGDLGRISTPIIAKGFVQRFAEFPLLAMVAGFGPGVAAAFVVSRRIRAFLNAPGWGFGLASSSLVGQRLGAGEEHEATAYGWDVLKHSLGVHLVLAVLALAFARPITRAFISDPELVPLTTTFVRVAAVSVLANAVGNTTAGALNGSGDTRWPLYGKALGLYGFTLPLVYLGLYGLTIPVVDLHVVAPLGTTALYLALLTEAAVPAAVSFVRFRSGTWTVVSRKFRPEAAD